MEDRKVLLISHVADEDGITPVIMAKQVFSNLEYVLTEPKDVDNNYLENIDKYDFVYITDLNVSPELAKEIDEKDEWKNKTLIFDHHQSALELNKYDFITVIVENNDRKESATSIFYNYLLNNFDNEVIKKDSVKGLVEQVRIIDTYDFKTEKDQDAHNLDLLFSILGRENYFNYFSKYIVEKDIFEYGENELFLIKLEKDKLDNYLKSKSEEMIRVKLDGYNVGVVYAERYRSQVGNLIVNTYEDIDFAVIINISRSISYRGLGKVDLSVYSAKKGGGGHKNAAGSSLPDDLLLNITKLIFDDVDFIKESE